jgi:hypothetical protein
MAAKSPVPGLEIKVKYTRSPTVQEIPVSGVFGAISHSGDVFMAVYSERGELPETATLKVVGDPSKPESLNIVDSPDLSGRNERTVHAVLHFDVDLARSLRRWLDDKISAFEALKK